GEPPRLRVIAIQSPILGTHPNHPFPVHEKGEHEIVTQAAGVLRIVSVGEEFFRCTIKAVESSAVGSKPKGPGRIFANRGNLVIGKALPVFGIVPVESELAGPSIQPVEPTLGADPKESPAVPLHRP